VFISHAGPQKANFAVWLQRELRRHGISAFLDERSLNLCDAAGPEMEAALRSCSIVVVVLTLDFVRSTYCMEELHWALHASQPQLRKPADAVAQHSAADRAPQQETYHRQSTQQGSKEPWLLPVFYRTSDIDELQQDVEQQIADACEGGASPAQLQRLQQAGKDLGALCGFTGDRLDSHNKCVQLAFKWLRCSNYSRARCCFSGSTNLRATSSSPWVRAVYFFLHVY
jgi:TIR domain